MKKSLFIFVLCLNAGVTFIACEKDKVITPDENAVASSNRLANLHWLRYDETKCNNPWKSDWLVAPTDEQLINNLSSFLQSVHVNFAEIRISRDKEIINCSDCTCSDGIHYFVRVMSAEDMQKLMKFNFYEVSVVPSNTTSDTM